MIDFSKLPICPDNKAAAICFTEEQVSVIKSIYSPIIVDDKMVYPSFPVGLEGEVGSWDVWISGTSPLLENEPSWQYVLGTNLFKYLVYNNPSWNYSQHDFKNFFEETRFASAFLNATQTDYSSLKKVNGMADLSYGLLQLLLYLLAYQSLN